MTLKDQECITCKMVNAFTKPMSWVIAILERKANLHLPKDIWRIICKMVEDQIIYINSSPGDRDTPSIYHHNLPFYNPADFAYFKRSANINSCPRQTFLRCSAEEDPDYRKSPHCQFWYYSDNSKGVIIWSAKLCPECMKFNQVKQRDEIVYIDFEI